VTVEVEIENHSGWRVDEPAAAAVLRSALAAEGVDSGEVGLEFVDERRIAELNGEHRGKPSATDVLSFPIDGDDAAGPVAGPRELGDVVICAPQTTELREAIVHGTLHLTGMDHETDQGEMLALQAELLSW
jgi:probable rRNA maturation factor